MKNIFLLAKYIAIETNAQKIELSHLKEALSSLEILDDNAKEILEKITKTNNPKTFFSENNIQDALKAPKKEFSLEVEKIMNILNEKGITLGNVISKLTVQKTNSSLLKNIKNIKKELSSLLFEQDMAVEAIADTLMRSYYIENTKKPKGVFLFAGDVGSGKSFAAKTFSDLMSSDGYIFKSFNMSSYTSDNESFVLNGLSRGYSGAKEGELTSFVAKNPKCIILFDSIDKAHNNVVNSLNEILDSGVMLDNYTGKKVDFSNVLIIFETNAGKEIFLKPEFNKIMKKDSFMSESMLLDTISKEIVPGYKDLFVLPREFLSSMSDASIVIFNKLTFNSCVEILKSQIIKEQTLLEKNFDISIKFESLNATAELLVLSSGPDYSIRKILKKAPFSLFDPITDFMLDNDVEGRKVIIRIDNSFMEKFNDLASKENREKLLHNLFRKNKTGKFQIKIDFDLDNIFVKLDEFSIEIVKRVADFGGETGLIIEVPDEDFSYIAGHEKVKTRLNEIIDILKSKELNEEYSEFISKGMLLYGPPGTGKTMLAKAFAKEADLPFIATTGPDMFSDEAIRNVFKKAREYAPSIIFIDEIDVFKHRGKGYSTDIYINKLLTEIDGFSNKDENRIFIIAATNLKDQIDRAILRSGRIDLHIEVDALDKIARGFFINRFLKSVKFSTEINNDKIIKMTAGFSGADLKKLEREVILDAYRKNIDLIDEDFLVNHVNIMKFGEIIENNQAIEESLEQTAYHETGHAIVSKVLFPDKKIEQITIVPRKNSLGFVAYEFKDDIQYDVNELKNMICVSLAGRVSEQKKFGDSGVNSGADSDLEKVIKIAYMISSKYAMLDNVKSSYFHTIKPELFLDKVELQIENIIKEMLNKTENIIDENWKAIEDISKVLLDRETIYQNEIDSMI